MTHRKRPEWKKYVHAGIDTKISNTKSNIWVAKENTEIEKNDHDKKFGSVKQHTGIRTLLVFPVGKYLNMCTLKANNRSMRASILLILFMCMTKRGGPTRLVVGSRVWHGIEKKNRVKIH